MATIDPRKRRAAREAAGESAVPELGAGVRRISRECKIPGAVVGWEHYNSSRKGTPGLLVRFVALADPDAGAITERTFWLTDAATDQFLDFLLALGHDEPIDPNNNDHLEVAFAKGAVMMDVKGEEYTYEKDGEEKTRTSYRPAWFGAFKGKSSKAWNKVLEDAEKGWSAYCEWRKKNPRDEPSGGGGGGGEPSGSGGRFGGDDGGPDEEIPFSRCCNEEPAWVRRLL